MLMDYSFVLSQQFSDAFVYFELDVILYIYLNLHSLTLKRLGSFMDCIHHRREYAHSTIMADW